MTPRGLQAGADWYAGTRGRHVLLAACRDDQTAKEHSGDGRRRGAFSYFLVDTLKTLGGELTYRDLFARTDSLVRSHIDAQMPQIEVVQAEDLDAKFLDGTVQPSSPYFIVDYTPGLATLRAGAIHGIARPTADGTTVLALFPLSASDQDLEDLDQAVGQAKVIGVQSATCRLQVSGLADPNAAAIFKAIVVGLPTSRLVVRLEGEQHGVEVARTALKSAGQGERAFALRTRGRRSSGTRRTPPPGPARAIPHHENRQRPSAGRADPERFDRQRRPGESAAWSISPAGRPPTAWRTPAVDSARTPSS